MYYCLRRGGLDAEPASPESYYIIYIYYIIIVIITYLRGRRRTEREKHYNVGRTCAVVKSFAPRDLKGLNRRGGGGGGVRVLCSVRGVRAQRKGHRLI